jgi:hypothetical protein
MVLEDVEVPSQPSGKTSLTCANILGRDLILGIRIMHPRKTYSRLSQKALRPSPKKSNQKRESLTWVPMAHACNLATCEAEIGRIAIQGQPRQIVCETLSPK